MWRRCKGRGWNQCWRPGGRGASQVRGRGRRSRALATLFRPLRCAPLRLSANPAPFNHVNTGILCNPPYIPSENMAGLQVRSACLRSPAAARAPASSLCHGRSAVRGVARTDEQCCAPHAAFRRPRPWSAAPDTQKQTQTQAEVGRHEPRLALDGGAGAGMDCFRVLVAQAREGGFPQAGALPPSHHHPFARVGCLSPILAAQRPRRLGAAAALAAGDRVHACAEQQQTR